LSAATRWASVLVLPEPAPAMMRRSFIELVAAVFDGAALLGGERGEVG
jgi:hypothetical protein